MSHSRSRILERIEQGRSSRFSKDNIEAVFQALCQKHQHDRVQPTQDMSDIVTTFAKEAQRNGAKFEHMTSLKEAVHWITDKARQSQTIPSLHLCPWFSGTVRDWRPVTISHESPKAANSWGMVRAHTAIAETGTMMSLSSECPSSLLFLVERLVLIVDRSDLVAFQEEAWRRLESRSRCPRTVNLITGPSRTADIEQQIQIGAHGPRQTDYILVDSLSE